MFKLMTIALLSSTIALGPVSLGSKEIVEDRQPITTDNVKRATYDDVNTTIILTAYELNNYQFNNLTSLISEDRTIFNNSSLTYQNETYSIIITTNEGLLYRQGNTNKYIRFNDERKPKQFLYYHRDDVQLVWYIMPFTSDLTLNIPMYYYFDIKDAITLDIENQRPLKNTIFDSIYDYFDSKVFDSEYLNEYEMEIMGHTTSLRHYLCLTATIIFITLIVIFCVGFIVMLVKFVANMLINLGR